MRVGEHTFCPVSGVAFEVKTASATRELSATQPLYFCCESCARYFDENRERVIEVRKITPAPADKA